MTNLIFLGGLGANRYHAMDLKEALDSDMAILDLPGHGEELTTDTASLEAFLSWFLEKIAELDSVILIAHSMGANIAPYLVSHCPKIKQLILLDGGYFDLDSLVSLEEEIVDTQSFLDSQVFSSLEDIIAAEKAMSSYWSENLEKATSASYHKVNQTFQLRLNCSAIFHLLTLQRQTQGYLKQLNCPTLLIPQRLDAPEWKLEMLKDIPQNVTVEQTLNLGHSPHTEKPEQVAQVILSFIQSNQE